MVCPPGQIGRIGWRPIEMMPGQIGWKSIEITLYACLVESVKLGGQIWWKSTEMMTKMLLHWSNSTDSTGHHLNGFPPNLTDSTT